MLYVGGVGQNSQDSDNNNIAPIIGYDYFFNRSESSCLNI